MTLPLTDLARELRSGRLEVTAHAESCLGSIEAREPELRAFQPEPDRRERLLRDARRLVARFPDPASRPPLFGVPVGIKDIFHCDGLPTGAGSRLPPEELEGPQAAAVRTLIDAGALVVGKTATTEFAYFAPAVTRNPHAPEHTPGGSSSGSAAAVGSGLLALALGTQTIGSISRPAAFCAAVGYKPSYDRISRAGVIPLSPSLDHVGPFTADVASARLAAQVLVADWREALARPEPPVLGIPAGPYLDRAEEEGRSHFTSCCDRLAAAGFELRTVPFAENLEEIEARHDLIVAAEAARTHATWYPRLAALYHPKTAALIERGRAVSDSELERARGGRIELRRQLEQSMEGAGLDLWIAPGAPGPAPRGLDWTGDPILSLPFSQAGVPTICLPAGRSTAGLPLGLQLAARFGHDEALFSFAERVEAVFSPQSGAHS